MDDRDAEGGDEKLDSIHLGRSTSEKEDGRDSPLTTYLVSTTPACRTCITSLIRTFRSRQSIRSVRISLVRSVPTSVARAATICGLRTSNCYVNATVSHALRRLW